jgi:hypothetical protein
MRWSPWEPGTTERRPAAWLLGVVVGALILLLAVAVALLLAARSA